MNDHERFERFTEQARKVLRLAEEEAQRFNHHDLGTEHLLLGLIRNDDGVAAKVLSNLGITLNKARAAVGSLVGCSDRIVLGTIGLTPRAKKVLEWALDEARRLNHHDVGAEHLLLGLVRDGEDRAASVLASFGATLENVRTQTFQVLDQRGDGAGSGLHTGRSAPLEYDGHDLTAKLQDGTIHQLAPGTLVLGHYLVERSLGKGGMSNAYLAEDLHFSLPHNLRVLKEMIGRLDEQNHLSNFEREANVLASLRHPRIPRVYDYFTISHRAYLVLDFIEGQDLEAILNRTPGMARPEDVVEWMLQLCDIVHYLHIQPIPIIILHDLGLNNIILTPDGEIVLVDLGIARRLQKAFAFDHNVGTLGYAAPETYEGRSERRSDIFVVGAMMHHLLTKQDPRLWAPFSFHQHPIRHYNPAVSAELDAVVMTCVQYPIDKRFQSVRDLRNALEAAISTGQRASMPSPRP